MKRWWKSASGNHEEGGIEKEDITARELCRMMGRCPVCRGGFARHLYAHFAVTVFGEELKSRVREFFNACEDRDWEEVRRFQEFDSKRDAVVAYALKCRNGGMAMVFERSPFDDFEADRLIACEVLDEGSGQRLDSMIDQGEWRRLSWT
jgi:hypothetical protein